MNKSNLKKTISQQLNTLNEQVEKIRNTEINADEEEKWDPDHYSELQTDLENALALLKDEVVKNKQDSFGDPIIINKGILTLLDEWKEENSENDEK